MQTRALSIKSNITATYTSTNTWTDVPGLKITVPEDGNYSITRQLVTNAPAAHGVYTRFAINGNPIYGTSNHFFANSTNPIQATVTGVVHNVALKASDIVSAQVIWDTADATINYVSGLDESYIEIIKVGV